MGDTRQYRITSQDQAGNGECPRVRGGRRDRVIEEGWGQGTWGAMQHMAKGCRGDKQEKGESVNEKKEKEKRKKNRTRCLQHHTSQKGTAHVN